MVKQKEVSEEAKKRKEALLAQYAHVTDEEEYPFNTYLLYSVMVSMIDFHDTLLKTNYHSVSLKLTVQLIQCGAVSLTFVLKMRRRNKPQWEYPLKNVSFLHSIAPL